MDQFLKLTPSEPQKVLEIVERLEQSQAALFKKVFARLDDMDSALYQLQFDLSDAHQSIEKDCKKEKAEQRFYKEKCTEVERLVQTVREAVCQMRYDGATCSVNMVCDTTL